MQTSLPDLPFPYTDIIVIPNEPKSSVKTTRTYPRSDLTAFNPWISFATDVHQAVQAAITQSNSAPGMPLTVGNLIRKPKAVANEEALRAHADVVLHQAVVDVLEALGVEGKFVLSGGGNLALVGDPDFSWVRGVNQMHSKLVIEYKTDWAADLKDLPTFFAKPFRNVNEKQSVEALEQIYGYMTFNNTKYGILTNWRRAWFLRRIETDNRKTLEYACIELQSSLPSPSMLKVWVGMVLLAEDDWFYASPSLSSPPPHRYYGISQMALRERHQAISNAGMYAVAPINGEYPRLTLDFRLCKFDLSSARRGSQGCVVNTYLLQAIPNAPPLLVVCKVVDVICHHTVGTLLEAEARAYAALQHLQGTVIPTLYGYYDVWEILHLLALEPVGDPVADNSIIAPSLRQCMKAALKHIHDAGYIHGDIACRNFCVRQGAVFVVDLEFCKPTDNQALMEAEIHEVDAL